MSLLHAFGSGDPDMFGSLKEAHPTASFKGRPQASCGTACPGSGPVWGLSRPWGVKALPGGSSNRWLRQGQQVLLAVQAQTLGLPVEGRRLQPGCISNPLASSAPAGWPWQHGWVWAWEWAGWCTCFGHCPQRLLTGWFWWELFCLFVCLFDVFLGDSETTGLSIGYWRLYGKILNSA